MLSALFFIFNLAMIITAIFATLAFITIETREYFDARREKRQSEKDDG